MRRGIAGVAALLVVCGAFASEKPWVLDNVHLVRLTAGEVERDRALVVEGSKIRSVTAAGVELEGATVVDGAGGYVIPGLSDLHVHLRADEEVALFLAAGVTRILDLNASEREQLLRDRIASGDVVGPHLHLCGGAITGVADAATARATVDGYVEQGVECLKPYGDIEADAMKELVRYGREKGLFSIGHVPRNLTWKQMLEARPAAIAHAEEFLYSSCCTDEERDEMHLLMTDNPTALVATLTTYDNIAHQADNLERYLAGGILDWVEPVTARDWGPGANRYAERFGPEQVVRLREGLAFQFDLVRRLRDAGVTILLGTDAGNVGTLAGVSVHDELEALVAAGLTPREALLAATDSAYDFLGVAQTVGALSRGQLADFVVLGGNPLELIGNVRLVRGVSVAGRWLDQEDLNGGLRELRETNRRETELFALFDEQGDAAVAGFLDDAGGWRPRPRILNEFGYIRWYGDARPQGVKYFERNVELHPDHWLPHASLAEIYEELERTAEAVRHYTRAVELNRHYRHGRERLRALSASEDPRCPSSPVRTCCITASSRKSAVVWRRSVAVSTGLGTIDVHAGRGGGRVRPGGCPGADRD